MIRKDRQTTHVGHIGGEQWSGAIVRFKGHDILFVAVYLQDSVGWGGRNGGVLRDIESTCRAMRIGFVIGGDWNMTPEELNEEGWVEHLGGVCKTPPVGATCSSGKGRMLDYAVCSKSLEERIELEIDWDGPWAPHRGVFLNVKGGGVCTTCPQDGRA